ncbi:MAG: Gfo/Idh/MocA family oxidoreductase [Candidatus Rokubacteria bacterium]|nr:Gfo/Idh/MocA family oxidoreductase [Candidatus Rokubacteria bacterium]
MADELRIAVIGLGHWGPNHVRVFNQCRGSRVVVGADPDERRRNWVLAQSSDLEVVSEAEHALERPDVDAVVIATPTRTHHALAKAALEAGKHVLLEKPMCSTVEEAEELVNLARTTDRALVHGHVFVYNCGIEFVREHAVRGEFGAIQYVYATRTNLGPIRYDVDVVQDLATHELAIFDYLFGELPTWVAANGSRVLGTAREDVAFVALEYGSGILAHVHVSWLDPQKTRRLTLVGDRRMVVWNDVDPSEPVRLYDKGVKEEPYYDSFGEFKFALRDADVLIPKIELREPLRRQAEAFVKRVVEGTPTRSEAESGLRVMRCLDAIETSLVSDGRRCPVPR